MVTSLLREFIGEADLVRSFAVLNSTAVTKILKKARKVLEPGAVGAGRPAAAAPLVDTVPRTLARLTAEAERALTRMAGAQETDPVAGLGQPFVQFFFFFFFFFFLSFVSLYKYNILP
jgi:hypothetical protein